MNDQVNCWSATFVCEFSLKNNLHHKTAAQGRNNEQFCMYKVQIYIQVKPRKQMYLGYDATEKQP